MNNEFNSIVVFNNMRRDELKQAFAICKSSKETTSVCMFKLSWLTGEKVNLELGHNDKLVYTNKYRNRIEEERENDFLNYYWIEFGIKEESIVKYKISLFYKDFDSNTGNIHVLPGALQCWKYVNENKKPISKGALRCGYGINTYNEYGWEPFYKKPLFFETDKLGKYITIILEQLISKSTNIPLNDNLMQSNIYYKDFICEREKYIKNKLKRDNRKGYVKRGHYLKYALIEWFNVLDNSDFESFQEIFLFRDLGYFAKYSLENTQSYANHYWELKFFEYKSKY